MTDEPILITRFFVGALGARRLPDGSRTFTYTPPREVMDGDYTIPLGGSPWILPCGRVN